MFQGRSKIKLDSKGRFALPKKIRQTLKENFTGGLVVTLNPYQSERCLLLYPQTHWSEIKKQLEIVPNIDPRIRKFQRRFTGHAEDLSLDSAGRLLLPEELRKKAALEHVIIMVGQGRKWELWSESLWQQYIDPDPDSEQDEETLPLQITL